MQFGGMQKNSFIDYPEKISCVLFCQGCNFHCPYCHNPELVPMQKKGEQSGISEKEVLDFLQSRRKMLDGVVISGGEPCLQTDLPDFCKKIKEMGYPLKVDSNGSRPEVLRSLLEKGLADYIAMDIKSDLRHYAPLIRKNTGESFSEKIRSSIRLIMESGLPYEFRSTCIRPLLSEKILMNICELIRGAELYALQQFQPDKVLHPEFFEGKDYIFSAAELEKFRETAEKNVRQCIVR